MRILGKRIIVNSKEVEELFPESLPMLIHGQEGSGSSLYTIALAAKWLKQGYDILFLCGYQMAQEEFIKMCGQSNAKFFTKDEQEEFRNSMNKTASSKRIVFVKNIELFGGDIFELVTKTHNFILSGDINESKIKKDILSRKYVTNVYFSHIQGVDLPTLNKYEGFVISDDFKGITKLSA